MRFWGDQANEFVSRAGVLLAGAIVVLVLFFLVVRTYPLTKEFLFDGGVFSFYSWCRIFCPTCTSGILCPRIFSGFFYLFRYPKRFYIPLVLAVVDTLGQANFLFGIDPYNPIQPMSLLVLWCSCCCSGFCFRRPA